MSTTTVTYDSTTLDIAIADLRRIEAEARAAARKAAREAERERRREEQERQRIERASTAIAQHEESFQRAVATLDEAARRLPDLMLVAPKLPVLGSDFAGDLAQLEAYAKQLQTSVTRFEQQLHAAIEHATNLLQRRIAKAKAWQHCLDMEQQHAQRQEACAALAAHLGHPFTAMAVPERPGTDAELESVQTYEKALQSQLEALGKEHAELCSRKAARSRAAALAGPTVVAEQGTASLKRYETERREAARSALLKHRDETLQEFGLTMEQLPDSVCNLIEGALEDAHLQDQRDRITYWIAHEEQRRSGVTRVLEVLQCAPDLVHDDRYLGHRWSVLSGRLQRIAGGLEDFGPDVDREYEQLQSDAARLRGKAYASVDWIQRMREEDFEVLERDDGNGLYIVDLTHPEVWLEVSEPLEAEGALVRELNINADTTQADEAGVTDSVCKRLAKVAGKTSPQVKSDSVEIERDRHIKRRTRPAKKREQPF